MQGRKSYTQRSSKRERDIEVDITAICRIHTAVALTSQKGCGLAIPFAVNSTDKSKQTVRFLQHPGHPQ